MQQFVSDEEDNSAEMDKALKLHVVVNWTELLKK